MVEEEVEGGRGVGQWKARGKGSVGWEVSYFNLMALGVYQSRV